MSELKEQNSKWPRWFKDPDSLWRMDSAEKGQWYCIRTQEWGEFNWTLEELAADDSVKEITAEEAAKILRKRGDETCRREKPGFCSGAEETNAPINPWHPIDDLRELPEDVTAKVELFNDDESKIEISDSGHLQVTRERYQKYYTHWRLHIPPPEKVVDDVEECRKAWFADNNSSGAITEIIAFALNWAKEREKK